MIDAYNAWLAESIDTHRTIYSEIGRAKRVGDIAIEKDYWVTLVLRAIFSQPYGSRMVFKGGTSLGKGWNVIQRFSEDIDLAIDREFLGFSDELNKSQRTKLRKLSKKFIEDTLAVDLRNTLCEYGFGDLCEVIVPEVHESDRDPVELFVKFKTEIESRNEYDYMPSQVKVEISCRSMFEPFECLKMRSMVAEAYPDEAFADEAFPVNTVLAGRTFLEKAFLLHEEFVRSGGCSRCYRLTRHIYDLEKMMDRDFAVKAMNDETLYNDIVRHRKAFTAWSGLDYNTHSPQTITLVPPEKIHKELEDDYANMQSGFIYGDSLPFAQLIARIAQLQERFRSLPFSVTIPITNPES